MRYCNKCNYSHDFDAECIMDDAPHLEVMIALVQRRIDEYRVRSIHNEPKADGDSDELLKTLRELRHFLNHKIKQS